MNNGLGYKLANVPTITGLSTVTADAVVSESVNTETLFLNGVDVSGVITQVPINTANIAILQQLTTGISYSDAGGIDLTTIDNNVTITSGKKLKCATTATANDDVVNKLFVDNALVNITGISYSDAGGIDLTTIDNNVTITSGKKLKSATTATANDDVTNKLFVDTAIANLVNSAPATLDTLNELAAALGDDPNFATTVTTLIAGKVSLTATETISGDKTFNGTMIINSGHNWRFYLPSTGITASITLSFPFYQIYPIVVNTPITITLPTPTSAMIGAHLYFKKLLLNSVITFNVVSGSIVPFNGFTGAGSVSLSTSQYQTEFYCNGSIYYQVNTDLPNFVSTDTTQTISATKTFTAVPLCATAPTTANMLCNKTYVDSVASTTISTTDTTTLAYYLVGSTSQTTSSDTTLYKSNTGVGVYVNPASNALFAEDFTCKNSNGSSFNIKFNTPTSDNFLFNNTADTVAGANQTIFQNINSTGTTRTTLTLSGDAGASTFDGLASASTTVAVADDNSATTMYPVFTTTGAGQKNLLFDTSTTPLRYKASSGEISAYQYSVGGILEPVPGNNAGLLSQNTGSSATVIQNQATSGKIRLITTDALNNLVTSIETSTSATTINSATSIIAGSVGSASSLVVKDSGTRSFQFIPNASGGALNNLTVLNDSLLYGTAGTVGTGALTFSVWSNTTTGVRITPTTALIGAGGTGATPSSYASFQASGVTIGGATNMIVGTGASSTRAFQVDESGGIGISMLPNSTVGSYNPLIVVNDSVIFADNTAINTSDLVLTTWSATTCGVRINATTALIGAGGAGATPTAYVSCNGSTVTVKGELQITDRNLLVDAGANALTIGNGASTATSNILITRVSLAQTRAFTTGGNTIIGNVAGNALVDASANNTFVGTSAGSTATGSNNICIGNSAQVPTVGNNNQISIGTVAETMYIRGGFNLRVGAQITNTATGNLATAVLAQFYTVAMSVVSQTIALPNPTTAAYLGAMVTFKRKSNATIFTITSTGGASFIPIGSITPAASPISIGATIFQVTLVCDGTNWCIISQA